MYVAGYLIYFICLECKIMFKYMFMFNIFLKTNPFKNLFLVTGS